MIEAIECDYLQFIGKTSHIFKCQNSDLFSGSHKHSIKIIISEHRSIHVWFGICYFLYLFHSRTQKYNKSLSLSHIYTLTITHFGFHKRKFIEHKSCEWNAACVKNVIKIASISKPHQWNYFANQQLLLPMIGFSGFVTSNFATCIKIIYNYIAFSPDEICSLFT